MTPDQILDQVAAKTAADSATESAAQDEQTNTGVYLIYKDDLVIYVGIGRSSLCDQHIVWDHIQDRNSALGEAIRTWKLGCHWRHLWCKVFAMRDRPAALVLEAHLITVHNTRGPKGFNRVGGEK